MIQANTAIHRWKTRAVKVGDVEIGADNPIRIQSMTTTDTKDVKATVEQSLRLAEAGCEIVRITAPNLRAAQALKEIRQELHNHKCHVPLVADIHFLPQAAMEAVEHVEKVRVNPGNYADRKKFQIREYTDAQYDEELDRLHGSFSPLVLRCKELGRTLRIGTNHGSLSDRILNRYGDTPKGMVESALEFIRIAESHGFLDIILSMKASNPKVMVQAYRLAVHEMIQAGMNYPLHLGVTEAGDGEDGRIKSTVGIGSLLLDGLGDTIRVSLTEDPVHEVPVAQELAKRAQALWSDEFDRRESPFSPHQNAGITPFEFNRRQTDVLVISDDAKLGLDHPPRVIVPLQLPLSDAAGISGLIAKLNSANKDAPVEIPLLQLRSEDELESLDTLRETLVGAVPAIAIEDLGNLVAKITPKNFMHTTTNLLVFQTIPPGDADALNHLMEEGIGRGFYTAAAIHPEDLNGPIGDILADHQNQQKGPPLILTLADTIKLANPLAAYRTLMTNLHHRGLITPPVWIRNTANTHFLDGEPDGISRLIDAALLSGSLLCDGLGNAISIENAPTPDESRHLAYNILQGARSRTFKTEFVACPSCGRTLFDLETTTQKVREATGHLSGVTIAVMGCIVNGPGEMADADFGYVGGAPGKINLYVGKECVQTSIPEEEAVDRLVDLIKEHNLWQDPHNEPETNKAGTPSFFLDN